MIQKTIREWLGVPYTNVEADELTQELNDRTVYGVDGYNSISELGANQQAIEAKTDYITVTAAVNLDDEKAATALNTAKRSYPTSDETKLDGIETGATADQTGSEIKSLYEAEANTNAYTDTEKTKLAGIESGATADQSNAEIKTAYESNANTNAYTDAEKTKLSGAALKSETNVFTDADNRFENGVWVGEAFGFNISKTSGEPVKFSTGDEMEFEASGGGIVAPFRFKGGGSYSLETESTGTNWFLPTTSIAQLDGNTGTKAIPTVEWVEVHTTATDNPHSVTKTQVGLSNADNTSDANKPISTATQTALDGKVSSTTVGEPTGSDQVVNMVSLTQAEYNAGTPVATTFYIITDA